MTPREKLEQFLEANEHALQLLILRNTNVGEHFAYYRDTSTSQIRLRFLQEVANPPRHNYGPILEKWGYPVNKWFPVNGSEIDIVTAYPTVEALIQEALSLGFLDQAIRCSQAWEKAKK